METYQLHNGQEIPKLGFGTWKLKGDVGYDAVTEALKIGYRHIDTASVYGNEAEVGQAIADSGIPREDIYLTTKIWNTELTYDDALKAFETSLEKLQTDYVDLLLIHWPNPIDCRQDNAWIERNAEVWRAMESLYEEGKVKAIGISNFMEHHIDALLETAKIKPMVNQIRLSPGITQAEVVAYSTDQGMLLQAYSPLGSGDLFDNEEIQSMSQKYDRSIAQIALRYSLQHGYLPLARSQTPANIESNLNIFDFELTPEDMDRLDQLSVEGSAPNPDERDF